MAPLPLTHPTPLPSTAPWCNECKKRMLPEVTRAAELFVDMDLPIQMLSVDIVAYPDIAKQYDVEDLPAFLLIESAESNSTQRAFPVLSSAEAIVTGASLALGLPEAEDMTPAKLFEGEPLELAQWLFWRGRKDGAIATSVVLFLPDEEESGDVELLANAFSAASRDLLKHPNLRFAACTSAEAMAEFEVPVNTATLVLYKDHDDGKVVYTGPLTAEAIKAWVLTEDVPMLTLVTHFNLQYVRSRADHVALFFLSGPQYNHGPTITRIRKTLQELVFRMEARGLVKRGEFTMGISDGGKYADSWLRVYRLPGDTPLPVLGVENTLTHETFHVPDFSASAATLNRPQEEVAEAAVGADGTVNGEEVTPPPPWVDVPVVEIEKWFETYATGLSVAKGKIPA